MHVVVERLPHDWPYPDGEQVLEHRDRHVAVRWKNGNVVVTVYLLTPDQHSVIVAARLSDDYERLTLEDEDDLEAIEDIYPVIGQFIRNGLRHQLAQIALVRIPELDTGDKRWFVLTLVSNIELDLDNPQTQSALENARDRVLSACIAINRSAEHPTGTIGSIGKGFWRGIKTGVKQTPRILVEVTLKALFDIALQSKHETKRRDEI